MATQEKPQAILDSEIFKVIESHKETSKQLERARNKLSEAVKNFKLKKSESGIDGGL